jgi:hypothetical protein
VVAVVTIKIHARPVLPVRPDSLATMVNQAKMVTVVHRAQPVLAVGFRTPLKKDVVDVHPDPKAIRVEPETPAVPDRKARLVNPAVMETQATTDKPVQPDQQAKPAATDEQAKKDNLAEMPKMENVAVPDPPVELDQLVRLVPPVIQAPMVIIKTPQDPQVQPVQQAMQATMEHPEIPVVKDNPAGQAKIVIIARAPVIAKRRSKLKLKLKSTTLTSFLLDAIFLYLAEKRVTNDF